MGDLKEDTLLDCRDLSCPLPVVRVWKEIKTLAPGQVVKVLATDRGSVADLTGWANDTGNELLHWHEEEKHLVFYVRKGETEE